MLKRKHLDVLSLADIPYKEAFIRGAAAKFIVVKHEHIVDLVEFLHENFPEDKPIIPLKILEEEYWLYIEDDNKNKI